MLFPRPGNAAPGVGLLPGGQSHRAADLAAMHSSTISWGISSTESSGSLVSRQVNHIKTMGIETFSGKSYIYINHVKSHQFQIQ
jgi:hypothetical protein